MLDGDAHGLATVNIVMMAFFLALSLAGNMASTFAMIEYTKFVVEHDGEELERDREDRARDDEGPIAVGAGRR